MTCYICNKKSDSKSICAMMTCSECSRITLSMNIQNRNWLSYYWQISIKITQKYNCFSRYIFTICLYKICLLRKTAFCLQKPTLMNFLRLFCDETISRWWITDPADEIFKIFCFSLSWLQWLFFYNYERFICLFVLAASRDSFRTIDEIMAWIWRHVS